MKEILIKGVATPVNFSLRVINNFARKYGMEFQSAMEGGNNMGFALLDHLASLTMEALNEGARRSGLTTRIRKMRFGICWMMNPHSSRDSMSSLRRA